MFSLGLILTFLYVPSLIRSECPTLHRSDVKHFDIRLPNNLTVPKYQTAYVCQQYLIPSELHHEEITAVAFTPLINNTEVMHHMILFACTDGTPPSEAHGCGALEDTCRSFLTVWSLGFKDPDICLYNNTGIPLGKSGYKTLSLQIHWNNNHPELDQTDNSGIRVYYTSKKVRYELGNVQIGQNDIEIPVNSSRQLIQGGCRQYCTNKYMKTPIYISRTFIHMHSLGVAGRMDHYRNGVYLSTIAYDQSYSYKHPPVHDHERAVQILPGDEVRLVCWFSTDEGDRLRNRTIYWGEGIEGEMCYAFVSYFPKTVGLDQCVQYADYDICDNYNTKEFIFGECDMRQFQMSNSGSLRLLESNCQEKPCTTECIRTHQKIYSHPCMQGRLRIYLEQQFLRTNNWEVIHKVDEQIQQCPASIM